MFVHKVLVHVSRCQRQVGVFVYGRRYGLHLLDQDDLVTHRGEDETLDVLGTFHFDILPVAP